MYIASATQTWQQKIPEAFRTFLSTQAFQVGAIRGDPWDSPGKPLRNQPTITNIYQL